MLTEHQEQCNFVRWMEINYPEHRVAATPNAAKRHFKTGKSLKDEGMSKGFPDLSIPSLFLYIEMKRLKGGRLSPEQKAWLEYLRSVGYRAEVAKGAEEAKRIVLEELEKRGRV